MIAEQCELVQDLIPLYIDNICSNESRRIITEHLKNCHECQKMYENMRKAVKHNDTEPELDSELAFRAISHKWKRKRISIICISVLLTAIMVFAGCMVYQEVSGVHDFFSPSTYANLRNLPDDEWYRVSFEHGNVLVFDSIFYSKKVTLDANSDHFINIRISDNTGTIVMEERALEPGQSLDLDTLQRNTEYVVEIKTKGDHIFLNFY